MSRESLQHFAENPVLLGEPRDVLKFAFWLNQGSEKRYVTMKMRHGVVDGPFFNVVPANFEIDKVCERFELQILIRHLFGIFEISIA